MTFKLPSYRKPDFFLEPLLSAPDARTVKVLIDGVAPDNYHAMSIYPEYFKVNGVWTLATESRMDSVPVVKKDSSVEIVEFRNLKIGDSVIVGRTEDASDGIYVHSEGFLSEEGERDVFAFRSGRSRETAYSVDYDNLYDLLRYERDHGYIVWVLGPAVIFDYDSKHAMAQLIEDGYADAVMAGNAMATHDLEGSLIGTALGQDIYTQAPRPMGHYNHLDLINMARKAGSLEALIDENNITDGVVKACLEKEIPLILAGSIRDDGPLPTVYGDVYKAQDMMRGQTRKATTLICLATQLHTIASGNMTPSYTVVDGDVRPVYIYSVDISEFAVNKLRDRGTLEVTTIVANVQDFLVLLRNGLVGDENK